MKSFWIQVLLLVAASFSCGGTTTIDATNHNAYGANIGWMDWRGDTNGGVVIGEYVCSGFLYAADVGWISLGNGSPPGGIYYSNTAAADWGVTQDGLGDLRGYAYGANIGWIAFETNGAPKVDLCTGSFSGYAWSANCGWISLSNAVAYVQTDTIQPGALAPDGLPIAWLLINFGTTNIDASADADGDGLSNGQEYLAGTDPSNGKDYLGIAAFSTVLGGIQVASTWRSASTRLYYLEKTADLGTPVWTDCGLGLIKPDGASTTRTFSDTNAPVRFYRVHAVRPLSPLNPGS